MTTARALSPAEVRSRLVMLSGRRALVGTPQSRRLPPRPDAGPVPVEPGPVPRPLPPMPALAEVE